MSIIQISKIQQRSGNIVDLPQLDEAELGFATDVKRLYIGKASPNENVEVLTSYSNIAFSQIQGSVGNLDITAGTVDNGQVLAYDGNNWVNKGGDAGGLITLGDVSNVKIDGGAISYVLQTDGTGNLSWTPKSVIIANVQDASKANPSVITTAENHYFTNGARITFGNMPGVAGSVGYTLNTVGVLYSKALTSNTFSLYTDANLTATYDASTLTAFPFTTATDTYSANNSVLVTSSAAFSVNQPIKFVGTTFGILNANTTYYVNDKPTPTTITLSLTSGGGALTLTDASGSCNLYATGGTASTSIGSGGGSASPGGVNTNVQFNNAGVLGGSSDFTWNTAAATYVLTVNGNANVGNLNATSSVIASTLTSNVSTGTAPIKVTSTTRVANLNVNYANVSDYGVVTTQSTGVYYPTLVSSSATGNRALGANANLGFNIATGNLSATILYSNTTITAVGNIVGSNVDTAGNVTASRLISNVSTGTAPLTVTSTTRVANLNVAYANVADFINVADVSTGTFYPILANAATGNVAEGSNANLTFNAATGALNSTLLGGILTTAAQPNVTSVGTLTSLTVSGTLTANDIATFGTAGDTLNITGAGNTNTNGAGGIINIIGAQGNGTGIGGNINVLGGNANSSGNAQGGTVSVIAGAGYGQGQGGTVGIYSGSSANTYGALGGNVIIDGGTYDGAGGAITISGGNAAGLDHQGGNVTIKAGPSTGAAAAGYILLQTSTPGSTGNTVQTLNNRVIVSDTNVNVLMTTQSTSTTTGALLINGGVGVAGNVYAGFFYGAGNGLSNIQGANVSGAVATATVSTTAGTVTTNAQPNITSTGTLVQLNANTGTLSAIQNPFTFDQVWNNSSILFTGIKENITDTASDANSNLIDLQLNGVTRFRVQKNGNVSTGNIITTGTISTTGNVSVLGIKTDNYYYANGVPINLAGNYSNSNVASYLPVYNGNVLANVVSASTASVTGNVIGNILTSNNDIRVGNVTADQWGRFRFVQTSTLYGFSYNQVGVSVITNEEASQNQALVLGDSTGNGTVFGISTYSGGTGSPTTGNEPGWNPKLTLDDNGNLTLTGRVVANTGLRTTLITAGANTTPGTVTGNWTLTAGSKWQSTSSDLAEYYESDQEYDYGTVVEFGGEKEITLASDETSRVAGVVSKDPAYLMNSDCQGIKVPIALQGRVPVKVRGKISKGDLMVSGGNGYARPTFAPKFGTIIGKSLENFDGVEGMIEIAVGRL